MLTALRWPRLRSRHGSRWPRDQGALGRTTVSGMARRPQDQLEDVWTTGQYRSAATTCCWRCSPARLRSPAWSPTLGCVRAGQVTPPAHRCSSRRPSAGLRQAGAAGEIALRADSGFYLADVAPPRAATPTSGSPSPHGRSAPSCATRSPPSPTSCGPRSTTSCPAPGLSSSLAFTGQRQRAPHQVGDYLRVRPPATCRLIQPWAVDGRILRSSMFPNSLLRLAS